MADEPIALILGDETDVSKHIRRLGFRPVVTELLPDALKIQEALTPAVVLIDLPGVDPQALRAFSQCETPVVLMGDGSPTHSQLRQRSGFYTLRRPVSPAELRAVLRTALPRHGLTLDSPPAASSGLGSTEFEPVFSSPSMRVIRKIIEEIADTNTTILLRGESGVGKDVVARAIHAISGRHHGPFVKVNCAALPAELLESELFGHEKGAFTGAHQRVLGKFEFANKGTIYLDEVGELPPALQAKLLHVVQDLQFSRIGGRELIRVDARIVAATNRNLEAALSRGEFREDLYYRLNVVEVRLPPLRERREEIPVLASVFLERFNREYQQQRKLEASTLALFAQYPWPGNVRELENVVRRLTVLGNAEAIHTQLRARVESLQSTEASSHPAGPVSGPNVEDGLREIARRAARDAERAALAEVLTRVRWNRLEAARILKVSYKTLLTKITECGLTPKSPAPRSGN